MRKSDTMLGKPIMLLLFPNSFINSIKHEHSCKILYVSFAKKLDCSCSAIKYACLTVSRGFYMSALSNSQTRRHMIDRV